MIIRFFSSFCSSSICSEAYTRISELLNDIAFDNNSQSCKPNSFRFTDGDDYTHAVILNTAMPLLTIPKENVIGLAFEPHVFLGLTPAFIAYAGKHIGKYFIGEKGNLPKPFIEHFSYMWHITPIPTPPIKTKIMSLMISRKMFTSGHQYRHTLFKRIINSNLPIDIYGNGCEKYKHILDTRLKGSFQEKEPYEDYLFHIAIENTITPHYFSEKIMNPLLCNTMPIYLGAKHIDTYFPKMVIKLTGEIDKDMTMLTDICENQSRYLNLINIAAVKKTINFANVVKLFAE